MFITENRICYSNYLMETAADCYFVAEMGITALRANYAQMIRTQVLETLTKLRLSSFPR